MAVAPLPPEVLTLVFEQLDVKDLLCAALVNRAWRAAVTARQILLHRHWEKLDHDPVKRRHTLVKEDVDWFAEVSSHVRTERAWEIGNFTTRFVDLPPNFSKINSAVEDTILITTTRPKAEGEGGSRWRNTVKVFHLVSNKFAIYQTFPQIPGEFLDVKHINGLGHVFNIVDYSHPRTYYYIPEDAYEWLGRPKKMTAGKFTWPKLPGFVFLGGQEIHSEGEVHIHVDGADGSSPALSMHEQDTDNLNWVRFAPWNGRAKMLSTCDESFIDHRLRDDCVIILSHHHTILVRHRSSGKRRLLSTKGTPAGIYKITPPKRVVVEMDFEAFITKVKDTTPSSKTVAVEKTQGKPRRFGKDEYSTFNQFVPIDKHLVCIADTSVLIYPDYTGPLYERAALGPAVIDIGQEVNDISTSGNRLIIAAVSAFYVLDIREFDNGVPNILTALEIQRWGIVPRRGYGTEPERGASTELTVTPRAIYEHLKVDPEDWDNEEGEGEQTEHPIKHLVRVYDFE